jgi:hypothetical protein
MLRDSISLPGTYWGGNRRKCEEREERDINEEGESELNVASM